MGYRDVSESLRQYRQRIACDLEDARLAAKQAQDRARRVRVLAKELAETDKLLAQLACTGARPAPDAEALLFARELSTHRRWSVLATVAMLASAAAVTAVALASEGRPTREPVPAVPQPSVVSAHHYLEGVSFSGASRR